MGTGYWARVVMMIVALIGVIMTMRSMNSGRPMTNPFESLFGSSAPSSSITLCPTRVTGVLEASGVRIFEEKMAWFREVGGQRQKLDTVAVEKWFAHHCTVAQAQVSQPAGLNFEPAAAFTYVNGQTQILKQAEQAGQTVYQWGEQFFHSPDLNAALHSFSALPEAKAPGTH